MRVIFSLLIVVVIGCRATNPLNSTTKDIGGDVTWQRIFTCQGDAVHVDVDTGDRRQLQVVLSDSTLFGYFDSTLAYGQIVNATERIYRGQTDRGVFGASDFVNLFEYDVAGTAGSRLGFEARRYDNTFVFRELDFVKTRCGGELRGNDYTSCEVANYVFHDCH